VADRDREKEECVSGPLVLYLRFPQLNFFARNEPPLMGSICVTEVNMYLEKIIVLTTIVKAICHVAEVGNRTR
jgi:hypothetical protein